MNVLFTSVGRRVELLRSFRNAYESLNLDGNIIAVDIDPLAPALQIADRHYIVPWLGSEDYIPTLIEICKQEHVNLVFPLIDPDIPILAHHKHEIETTGARLAVVSLSFQFFQRLGLPTPHSWLPGEFDSGQVEYPLFVKPRGGSAAKNTFQARNIKELKFFSEYVPDPIIQEYLPGPEITNDIICDLDSVILAVVSRQRIEVRWGEVAKGVTIYDPAIAEVCMKIALALPAVGPITVQCMMKGGVPHFTEINARMGGGIPLSIAAGVESPRWLLARAAGVPIDIPPLGSYQTGLYITRFDESFFLPEADREKMASNRI
jgi:carbamoyl-phosphate synthase large subunit